MIQNNPLPNNILTHTHTPTQNRKFNGTKWYTIQTKSIRSISNKTND